MNVRKRAKTSAWRLAVGWLLVSAPALALNVVWDGRTPEASREWADRVYVREQMEVLGAKICKALYGDEPRSHLHENFTIILYLAPFKGGNPAFASGRRITWKVGASPGGDATGGMGLLCHEMTHILDMGSDHVFTEAMADWTRNYKVFYHRCTSPTDVLNKRYRALRGGRRYGKYMSGANFIDFLTQNYGEGTIYKVLQGYRQYGKNPWEKLFGKTFDGLLEEWRNMETIYDPVFQWTYDGTAAGVVRNDGRFCGLRRLSVSDAADKSGVWLNGRSEYRVSNCDGGNLTLALHGRFPKKGKVGIASLGSATDGAGKSLLLATTTKADQLAVHVVASVPGRGCQIVSTTPISVPDLSAASHSVVLTVKGGDVAAVVVDGVPKARIDLKTKCAGCKFVPSFAVGGVTGGFGVAGFSEPQGQDGVLVDDVRVFNRTFRSRETASYAATFNAEYRGAVATWARWTGGQGSDAIDDIGSWYCVNSLGERVFVLPSKDTVVEVLGKSLPSIPPKSKFVCKSFTIDGLAIADEANIDLRGVRIVDLADNTRLVTRGGHAIVANAIRANKFRLDGSLAVTGGIKVSGNLEMKAGSSLRLPNDPTRAVVKSISFQGEGPVVLRPLEMPKHGVFRNLLRLEEMPEDLTRFRLNLNDDPKDATFKPATGGKFFGVSPSARAGK